MKVDEYYLAAYYGCFSRQELRQMRKIRKDIDNSVANLSNQISRLQQYSEEYKLRKSLEGRLGRYE